jgi:hypothetical protein
MKKSNQQPYLLRNKLNSIEIQRKGENLFQFKIFAYMQLKKIRTLLMRFMVQQQWP